MTPKYKLRDVLTHIDENGKYETFEVNKIEIDVDEGVSYSQGWHRMAKEKDCFVLDKDISEKIKNVIYSYQGKINSSDEKCNKEEEKWRKKRNKKEKELMKERELAIREIIINKKEN